MDEQLKALEELGEQFERVARDAGRARRRRAARQRRVLVLAVLGALLAAAAAMAAATGLLTGEPVSNPPGVTFEADEGVGRPVPGRTELLDLRVADPGDGPPWGMRVVRTTRGLGCVQVGRVVDGRLGVLGQNGAFGNDGRFHELPADVLTQAYCQQPDGAGQVFVAISYQGMPASALPRGCRVSGPSRPPRSGPGGLRAPTLPACRPADERIVYLGLLGPRATSVTYADARGRTVTAPVASGGSGGYLVVLRPTERRPARGHLTLGVSPGSGLRSVRYRDHPTCTIRSPRVLGGARNCPLVGYVEPRPRRVTAEQVRARVRATFGPRPVRPAMGGARPGTVVPRQWALTLTFRARLAGDAQSGYAITSTLRGGGRACVFTLAGRVDRDVRAGEIVRETIYVPARCRGSVRGSVRYRPQSSRPQPLPFVGGRNDGALVGRFAVRIPTSG